MTGLELTRTLHDIGDHLSSARAKARELEAALQEGDQQDVRIAPLAGCLVQAIEAAADIKAIALGEADEWKGDPS